MARTQVRLDQITGSFGDFEGGIVDSRPTAASLAAVPEVSGSLVDTLSHLASAIKRIHGGSAFTSQNAGVFGTVDVSAGTLTLANGQVAAEKVGQGTFNAGTYSFASSTISDLGAVTTADINGGTIDGAVIGGATPAAGTFTTLVANGNVDLGDANSDTVTFVAKVDSDILPTGTRDLGGAGDAWAEVHSDAYYGTGSLQSLAVADLTNNRVLVAGTSGEVEDDANFTWDGTVLTLGGQSQGTTQLSVSGDATITGDLTVSGVTTTLDTTNLLVEDVVIGMASGAASYGQNGGLAIFSGSSDSDLVIGRVASDTWGFGKKATLKGTVTDLSDMTVVSARASAFEIGGTTNRVDLAGVSSADLRIAAAYDLKLEAGGGQVYITGSLVPGAGATYSIGEPATSFLNLYVSNAYIGGVSHYDGPSNQVLVKSGSGGLLLKNSVEFADGQSGAAAANGFIAFQDALLTGSNSPSAWTAFNGTIPLASAKSEWDTFQSNFGQVSLVNAINAANTGTPGAGKATAIVTGSLPSGNIFTLSGFSHQDVANAERTSQVDVFVNGQLLLSGALNVNDYTLDGLPNNQVKFSFNLETDDVVAGIIR